MYARALEAARGYCASKEQYYYRFKGHLVVDQDGEIVNFNVTIANIDEREMIIELLEGKRSLLLGNGGFILKLLQAAGADIVPITMQ